MAELFTSPPTIPSGTFHKVGTRADFDGVKVASDEYHIDSKEKLAAIDPIESVTGGVWTRITSAPISDLLVSKTVETRTVPGPWVPFTRYDEALGPVQGRKRLVERNDATQTPSLTATAKTTYDGFNGSSVVVMAVEERWSNGTGSAGNPVYPFSYAERYDDIRGPIAVRKQLVVRTGSEVASKAIVGSDLVTTTYEAFNEFLVWKVMEISALPGPTITSFKFLKTNRVQKTTAQLLDATTIPTAGGTRNRDETDGQDAVVAIRRSVVTVNAAGASAAEPIYIFEKIIEKERVTQVTYEQEQPANTAAVPALNATYGTAGVWSSNTISSLTVTRNGTGYTSPPTVAIAAPDGSPATQATATAKIGFVTATMAAGSDYVIGDALTVSGGTFSVAATLLLSGGEILTVAIAAAGSGYAIGDRINLAGGTFSEAAWGMVTHLQIVDFVIGDGGSGHMVGDFIQLDTDATGTYAVLAVDAVDGGGAITSGGISAIAGGGGDWTTDPTVATANYAGPGTASAGGSGLIISEITVGIKTFAIEDGGAYTAAAITYTQGLSSGTGTGATFDSATYLAGLTIVGGGAYSVLPTLPATVTGGSGTGGTITGTAGITQLTVTNAGAGYFAEYPPVTFSGGGGSGARARANGNDPGWKASLAYIIDGRVEDIEGSPNRRVVWTTAPVPSDRKEFPKTQFTFPAVATIVPGLYPKPLVVRTGINFSLLGHRPAQTTAQLTIESKVGHWTGLDLGFSVRTPATNSRTFQIPSNTIHPAYWVAEDDDYALIGYGTNPGIYRPLATEIISASEPSTYSASDILTVAQWEERLWGDVYQRFTMQVCEGGTQFTDQPGWLFSIGQANNGQFQWR